MHVEHPAGLKPTDATDFVATTEGLTYEYRQLGARQPKGTGKETYKKKQPILAIEDQAQPWPSASSSNTAPWAGDDPRSRQHCRDWMAGGCVRKGLCPDNRIHKFPPAGNLARAGGKREKQARQLQQLQGQQQSRLATLLLTQNSKKSQKKTARAAKAATHV